ncbi:MAG: TonB-dependent receptor [Luteibaculaceae bacterium]
MKNLATRLVFLLMSLLCINQSVFAQGITTSSIQGTVTDQQKLALPGATVIAVHEPSGTRYGTVTNESGIYKIPNVRSGGPYSITFSYIGYQGQKIEDINLALGQTFNLNLSLKSGTDLGEVVIESTRDNIFDSRRTGASTNIGEETINKLPTISRSIQDFARLTPQANTRGAGISFGGTNNRFNQFSIDGTVNNDVFGLAASGTNGGQTGTQPISLDAIQEITVQLAPYDVRMGGFTGAGINAITRSGTNKVEGSVYHFLNNQNLVGRSIFEDEEGNRPRLDDYFERQTGFRVGAPIIKDKLFIFINGEVVANEQPKINGIGAGSNITQDEIDRVLAVVNRVAPNANVGDANAFNEERTTQKLFVRLDWNINEKNTFSIRHNYINAEELSIFRNPNTFVLSGGAQLFPSTTNTTVAELNTRFSNAASNELRVGYTSVRDNRTFVGDPFPFVRVDLGGPRNIQLGSEQFSTANRLDQDVITLTNNFSYLKGKHLFTVGTHNEFFAIENLFIRQRFGSYRYGSLAAWESVGTPNEQLPLSYDYSFSNVPGEPDWAPRFNALQLGFYIQDEYQVNQNLRVTAGIRADIPLLLDSPSVNPVFNELGVAQERGVATDVVPTGNIMWSPRIGANWDVYGDQSLQLRGGAGIFSGRLPFVWLSNQFSNTGNEISRVQAQGAQFPDGFIFQPDPLNQPDNVALNRPANTSEINVTDPNFRMPQVFRANLGADYKLPYGIILTFDGIFTQNINNIAYENLNVRGLVEADQAFAFTNIDNRPRFNSNFANTAFQDVILLTNTNQGHTVNLTMQATKQFDNGLFAMAAYTFTSARDLFPGTSSQAISNWRNGQAMATNPNDPGLGISTFEVPHRVIGALTYRKEYLKNFATSIGVFYNGQSGVNFSNTYNGDLNGDRIFGNDLIFLPENRDQIVLLDRWAGGSIVETADQQWERLQAFIDNNPELADMRGRTMRRNQLRTPFEHRFDVRIAQEVIKSNWGRLEFTFDIFNFGNMLNRDWGRSFNVANAQFIDVATGPAAQRTVNGEAFTGDANVAAFRLPGVNPNAITNVDGDGVFQVANDFFSRWRGQVGVRFTF